MKTLLYTLLTGAMALASCSKSDEAPNLPQSGEQLATFQIEAPASTRATVSGLSRYIVEAYEGKDLVTTPVRVEASTGSLTLELKKNTEYTFVFWADKGTANTAIATSGDYYDATKLQEVVVSAGKENTVGEVAYCLALSFNSKDFETNKAVVLKNATAQLNFTEAAGLATVSNSLTVKYSSGGKLNVATGTITEVAGEISRTYANIGNIAEDGIVASDYILAPLGEKRLLDLKVTFNSEPEKTITAVPFQQSYKTNVKGEFSNMYSSVFTISNEVADYENNDDVEFSKAKIGDFYYKDKTFSSTYTADAQNPCIGIVFVVNADGKTGKIVSLDKAEAKNWADAQTWTSSTVLPSGMTWSVPTKGELQYLYCGYTGVPAEPWEIGDCPVDAVTGAKGAFNDKLTAAGGTVLSDDFYWSSTEYNDYYACYVNFYYGSSYYAYKDNGNSVRVVSAF